MIVLLTSNPNTMSGIARISLMIEAFFRDEGVQVLSKNLGTANIPRRRRPVPEIAMTAVISRARFVCVSTNDIKDSVNNPFSITRNVWGI